MSEDGAPEKELGPSVPAGAVSRELLIINKRGLHARASAKRSEERRVGKSVDLGGRPRRQMSDEAEPEKELGPSVPAGAISRELQIVNKRGLHARASAKFVQMVEKFNAEVWVTRGSETVGGTSIMGLMMLAAGPGTSVVVSAIGPEAQAAVDAIAALVADKFNEEGV